jgi:hypothetical protein
VSERAVLAGVVLVRMVVASFGGQELLEVAMGLVG